MIEQNLEELFARVRALPAPERAHVAVVLEELVSDAPYMLGAEELAVLEPELEGARAGIFATHDDVDRVLRQPWRRTASE
jgi:hypothetical protein